MTLQENLACTINAYRLRQNLSITEFAEELGIARSSLQNLLHGQGNPRMDTVHHIADRLQVDPASLLLGYTSPENPDLTRNLLQTIAAVSQLNLEKQLEFTDLFRKMVHLWEHST